MNPQTQPQAAHTPTPWKYRPEINGIYAKDPSLANDDKWRLMIADTQGQTWNGGLLPDEVNAANAAFICEAVNDRERLLAENAALREVAEQVVRESQGYAEGTHGYMRGQKAAKALAQSAGGAK